MSEGVAKKKLTTRRRDQSIKARPWQCCDVAPRCGAYGVLALLHACSAPRVGLRSPLLCPPPLPSTSRPRQRDALVGKDPGVAAFRPCCSREELPPPPAAAHSVWAAGMSSGDQVLSTAASLPTHGPRAPRRSTTTPRRRGPSSWSTPTSCRMASCTALRL